MARKRKRNRGSGGKVRHPRPSKQNLELGKALTHPDAPPDEQTGAQVEMAHRFAPSTEDLSAMVDWIEALHSQAEMAKADGLPLGRPVVEPDHGRVPKARFLDMYGNLEAVQGSGTKPGGIDLRFLRALSYHVEIYNAAIMVRTRQVQRFLREPTRQNPLGFVVRLKDREAEPTAEDKQNCRYLTKWFTNCGDESKPWIRKKLRRDPLFGAVAKGTRDTYSMDAMPIELVELDGQPSGMHFVDGATIWLPNPEKGFQGNKDIYALQVVDGRPKVFYSIDQLIYEPRNPRTDILFGNGWGYSETEMIMRSMTAFVESFNFNLAGQTRNTIPPAILQIFGNYSPKNKAAFRLMWDAMLKGASKRFGLPVLFSRNKDMGAEVTPVQAPFDEMFFVRWMTLAASVVCAHMGMHPKQLNLDSFSPQASTLSGDNTAEVLAEANEKGLEPLLQYYGSLFTEWIVQRFPGGERYEFAFVGLHPEDKAQEFEVSKQCETVAELRAQHEKRPLGEVMQDKYAARILGDAPLNPQLLQIYQGAVDLEMQERKAEDPPEFGEGMPGEMPPGAEGQEGPDGQPLVYGDEETGQYQVTPESLGGEG